MEKKSFLKISFSLLWILFLIFLSSLIVPGIPTWPMFFVGIFSTVYKESKSISDILIQAVIGLLCAALFIFAAGKLQGFQLIVREYLPLALMLGFLLYGSVLLPKFCSMIGFAYYTMALIMPENAMKLLLPYLGMTLIGGGLQVLVQSCVERLIDRTIS